MDQVELPALNPVVVVSEDTNIRKEVGREEFRL